MRFRGCAEIRANFPDDQIEEDGEVILFWGRAVAEALAAMLRRPEFEVSDPEHQFEHGWDFEVRWRGHRVWIQVSDLGGVYVLATKFYPKFNIWKRDYTPYADVLTRLSAQMAADDRFLEVQWRRPEDVLSKTPGAPTPVDF